MGVREHEGDGGTLYAAEKSLLEDPARGAAMRTALRELAVIDSAERILKTIVELAKSQ